MSKMQRAIAIICNKGKGGRLQSCGKHEKIRKHHPPLPLPLPSPAISGFHSKQSKHLLNQMHRHDMTIQQNIIWWIMLARIHAAKQHNVPSQTIKWVRGMRWNSSCAPAQWDWLDLLVRPCCTVLALRCGCCLPALCRCPPWTYQIG